MNKSPDRLGDEEVDTTPANVCPTAGSSTVKLPELNNDLKDEIKTEIALALCSSDVVDRIANAVVDIFIDWLEDRIVAKAHEAASIDLEKHTNEIKELHKKISKLNRDIKDLQKADDEAEQYSRRNCLRIYGVRESPNENNKLDLNLSADVIDRSHRVTPKSQARNEASENERSLSYAEATRRGTPRPIIVKFSRYNARHQVYLSGLRLKDLPGPKLFIREDLTAKRSELYWKTLTKSLIKKFWTQRISAITQGKKVTIRNEQDLELL